MVIVELMLILEDGEFVVEMLIVRVFEEVEFDVLEGVIDDEEEEEDILFLVVVDVLLIMLVLYG